MSMEALTTEQRAPIRARAPRTRVWGTEVALLLTFYIVYTIVRNRFGSSAVDPDRAYRNAERIMDIERSLGTFWELRVQGWFVDQEVFLSVWNHFYGSFHFGVTIFALVWLYRRFPRRYARQRTAFLSTTGLALAGFALFPLMPPRLLSDCGQYGACRPGAYPFVDTVSDIGGLWSFDSGTMQEVTNQFAAMPSLHFAWATWCVVALGPVLRRRWTRGLIAAYPVATLFAVVVTANHYWLDGAAGVVLVAAGYLVTDQVVTRLRLPTTTPAGSR